MILVLTNSSLIYHFPRVHFGQITSNQMLLSVIDELRTNTISKVREIRVSSDFSTVNRMDLATVITPLI